MSLPSIPIPIPTPTPLSNYNLVDVSPVRTNQTDAPPGPQKMRFAGQGLAIRVPPTGASELRSNRHTGTPRQRNVPERSNPWRA